MRNHPLLEICTDSVAGALAAAGCGANRIELCAGMVEGGTTPSRGSIEAVREHSDLDLVILIRPRGGDFLYSGDELEVMRRDIECAGDAGADGIAVGVLTAAGEIDVPRMRELAARARPMRITCHRAFDMAQEPRRALQTLVDLGIDRVLTSGQRRTATEGIGLLAELVALAGEQIAVMPGGGVCAHNVRHLIATTGARAVHCSARGRHRSGMTYRNPECSMASAASPGEFEHGITDPEEVRRLAEALRTPV